MVEMISKIRKWLSSKRLIRSMSADGVVPSAISPVSIEDIRAINDVKSFNKSFDQQQQQMQSRAMVPHEADCDVISCKKPSCFKWEADKIVKDMSKARKRTKKQE